MIRLSTASTVEAIKNLQDAQTEETNLPCYMIPYGLNLRFFGRSAETDVLKSSLDPHDNCERLKVIAMYGTGGVGKTQIALHCANTAMELYDLVIWIPAETQIKMTQAVSKYATKLGLPGAEGTENDYKSIQNVRDWLNTSGKTFLLIFDNVENHEFLEQMWMCSTHWMADMELFQLLGGLPLAMVQISEFMNDRDYSCKELLPVYQKSAKRVFARSAGQVQYECTLDTV